MAKPEDRQAELVEHLAELRTRLVRSAIYTTAGTAICWFFYRRIFAFLTAPVIDTLKRQHIQTGFQMTGLAEGFMLQLQICLVSGLIVAAPLVTLEAWGFIAPALTREEKKPIRWIAPLSVLLFVMGVSLCYYILPVAIRWFVSYVPPNAEFRPFISQNLLFIVKMLFAFGLAFEMPIVLMFLGKLGIINSRLMKKYWRQAVLLTAVGAAIATPSSDAFSMLMLAVPMCILYVLSIYLVRIIEPKG
ncbi:MAG: twin-arginine translocase subunit TatC [Armatimonadota bacterium]|nr:twin-arginine translocase subunit TatC [Armatimonadota bacterium]